MGRAQSSRPVDRRTGGQGHAGVVGPVEHAAERSIDLSRDLGNTHDRGSQVSVVAPRDRRVNKLASYINKRIEQPDQPACRPLALWCRLRNHANTPHNPEPERAQLNWWEAARTSPN